MRWGRSRFESDIDGERRTPSSAARAISHLQPGGRPEQGGGVDVGNHVGDGIESGLSSLGCHIATARRPPATFRPPATTHPLPGGHPRLPAIQRARPTARSSPRPHRARRPQEGVRGLPRRVPGERRRLCTHRPAATGDPPCHGRASAAGIRHTHGAGDATYSLVRRTDRSAGGPGSGHYARAEPSETGQPRAGHALGCSRVRLSWADAGAWRSFPKHLKIVSQPGHDCPESRRPPDPDPSWNAASSRAAREPCDGR